VQVAKGVLSEDTEERIWLQLDTTKEPDIASCKTALLGQLRIVKPDLFDLYVDGASHAVRRERLINK
jgi:hypothetical protein